MDAVSPAFGGTEPQACEALVVCLLHVNATRPQSLSREWMQALRDPLAATWTPTKSISMRVRVRMFDVKDILV